MTRVPCGTSQEMQRNVVLRDSSVVVNDDGGQKAVENSGMAAGRSVLHHGFSLGKKVAIAGVVITSAPLVIPPLLIFSTLSLALAFPFTVYFASFACTDKVMRSLLPLSSPSLSEGDEEAAPETQEEQKNEREADEEVKDHDIEHLDSEDKREEGFTEEVQEEKSPLSAHSQAATAREIEIKPSSEYVEDDGNRRGVEIKEEEKPMVSVATGDENGGAEEEKKEDQMGEASAESGIVIEQKVEEEKPTEKMETRDVAEEMVKKDDQSPAATERLIEIEPSSLKSEYPSVPDEKAYEGDSKIPVEVKPVERTGETREEREQERKGEVGVDAFAPEVKEVLLEGYRIEIEQSVVDQSRKRGHIEMVEEERPAKEQKHVEENRKDEEDVDSAAPDAKEPPLEEHKIENEPTEADQSRNRRDIEMVEEERPDEEQKLVKERRKEEEGTAAAAPEAKERPSEEQKIETELYVAEQSGDKRGIGNVEEGGSHESKKTVEERGMEVKGMGADAPVMELPKNVHPVVVAPDGHQGEVKPSNLSSENASAIEDHSLEVADTESRVSVEQDLDMSSGTEVVAPTAKSALPSDYEDPYNEQKIWKQIYAIRVIVGYKTAVCSSLIGELNALYLFTGVEPSISSKDASNLTEVNDKLQFLKSVIGVK